MAEDTRLSNTERTKALIEGKINPSECLTLGVGGQHGGIAFENMTQVMEAAKLMSVSEQAVPPHCRNKPGVCFALAIQAIEWKMSPFSVANKSYVVNDRVAYESQLIHAVIESRAPIKGRLRAKWGGEGDSRTCTVWATPTGEDERLEYTSPPISQITPKNSPLWKTKPDLQLFYNTSRDWARMFFPDVIMGVYSPDEIIDHSGLITSHSSDGGNSESRAKKSDLGAKPPAEETKPAEAKPAETKPEAKDEPTEEAPKKKRGRPKKEAAPKEAETPKDNPAPTAKGELFAADDDDKTPSDLDKLGEDAREIADKIPGLADDKSLTEMELTIETSDHIPMAERLILFGLVGDRRNEIG